jgi:hypothetical protein
MHGVGQAYRLFKLTATGIVALILGIAQVATGERQGIVGGSGALLAAAVIFGLIGWSIFRKGEPAGTDAAQPPEAERHTRVLWLGISLTLLPGLLWLYLRYSMDPFDPGAAIFVGVPLLIAGIGCLGIGLWSAIKI